MSAKTAKPPKEQQQARLFVSRDKLSRVLTLKPPTDEQRAVLATGMAYKWPSVYEMFPTDDVKQVLTELDVVWSDKK